MYTLLLIIIIIVMVGTFLSLKYSIRYILQAWCDDQEQNEAEIGNILKDLS